MVGGLKRAFQFRDLARTDIQELQPPARVINHLIHRCRGNTAIFTHFEYVTPLLFRGAKVWRADDHQRLPGGYVLPRRGPSPCSTVATHTASACKALRPSW